MAKIIHDNYIYEGDIIEKGGRVACKCGSFYLKEIQFMHNGNFATSIYQCQTCGNDKIMLTMWFKS